MKTKKTKVLMIRVTEEEKEEIEKLAEYMKLPVGTMTRNLLISSYREVEILKRLGFLKGVKNLLEFKEKLSIVFKKKPEDLEEINRFAEEEEKIRKLKEEAEKIESEIQNRLEKLIQDRKEFNIKE